jgi:O-antigen/teichoic acid export membrane protein
MSENVAFLGDFSRKLATNTFFTFLGRCWSFILTLLLTPYILAHLNVQDFGTWVLMSMFISAFNPGQVILFDLGLVFVKYISHYYTHDDFDQINRVLFSGLLFYGVFGVVLVSVGLIIRTPLFHAFHIPDSDSRVYLLVLVSSAIANIAAMFLSVFKGIQRMDKSTSIEVKLSLLNAAGTVLFLGAGWRMFGLAVNALINACCAVLLTWWAVRRMLPRIGVGAKFDGTLLRGMLTYGMKMQISSLGALVCFQVPKLIVSRFLGIATVSFYEVSSRLALFMRAFPLVMISTLIPATSELGARNDRDRILQTYLMASKYVAMITVAMVAFLVVEARSVLLLWLGQGFESSIILVQILAIGFGANILGGPASQTGAGIGRPEFDMRSAILLTILTPIFGVVLVQGFGVAGVAAGTSLALILATAYLLITFHRNYVGDSLRTVLEAIYVWPIAGGVCASLAVVALHQMFPQLAALGTVRYLVPARLVADFGLFSGTYVLLLIAFRQFTQLDWNNFLSLMSFGFGVLRHPFRERVKIYR